MLHTAIRPVDDAGHERDPDVEQAIVDFRGIAHQVRDHSARIARLSPGRERTKLEQQVSADMAAIELRARRIGGGWTGASLLAVVQMDIDARARRVPQPRRGSSRAHIDRVSQAIARQVTAKRRVAEAQAEYAAATAEVAAAEQAQRYHEARGAR